MRPAPGTWNASTPRTARSKREAEALVLRASREHFSTIVLCPGMVLGPRDPKPTSTRLLHLLARSRVAFLPRGGIPIVDAEVVARAHRRALILGRPGERYAVVGPYLSYPELARIVAAITGRPRTVIPLPDRLERPLKAIANLLERLGLRNELSGTTVAGGFLHLHVSGNRADACFGLVHPPPLETVRAVLDRRGPRLIRPRRVDLSKPSHGVGPRCVTSVGTMQLLIWNLRIFEYL